MDRPLLTGDAGACEAGGVRRALAHQGPLAEALGGHPADAGRR